MTSHDNTSPEQGSTPLPSSPLPSSPLPSSPLPSSPWILLDRTTATQAATVLDRLEQWLAGAGEQSAVQACAAFCSLEQDDAFSVAAWVGALAARLERRIAQTDSWETDSWETDSWS